MPLVKRFLWQAGTGHPVQVHFGRDKFTICLFASFIDALMDGRMYGHYYTTSLLTFMGAVVCQHPAWCNIIDKVMSEKV